MNKVSLIGRLTRDVDLRTTQSGTQVAKFTLAVNRRRKDNGADFISCTAWSKTAELMDKYVHKGDRVGINGRIQTGEYTKDGVKHYTTEVVVEDLEFLEKKNGNAESSKPTSAESEFVEVDDWGDLPF